MAERAGAEEGDDEWRGSAFESRALGLKQGRHEEGVIIEFHRAQVAGFVFRRGAQRTRHKGGPESGDSLRTGTDTPRWLPNTPYAAARRVPGYNRTVPSPSRIPHVSGAMTARSLPASFQRGRRRSTRAHSARTRSLHVESRRRCQKRDAGLASVSNGEQGSVHAAIRAARAHHRPSHPERTETIESRRSGSSGTDREAERVLCHLQRDWNGLMCRDRVAAISDKADHDFEAESFTLLTSKFPLPAN